MPLLKGGFIRRLHPAGTLYLTLSYADLPEAYCRAKFAAAGVHQASTLHCSALRKAGPLNITIKNAISRNLAFTFNSNESQTKTKK